MIIKQSEGRSWANKVRADADITPTKLVMSLRSVELKREELVPFCSYYHRKYSEFRTYIWICITHSTVVIIARALWSAIQEDDKNWLEVRSVWELTTTLESSKRYSQDETFFSYLSRFRSLFTFNFTRCLSRFSSLGADSSKRTRTPLGAHQWRFRSQ